MLTAILLPKVRNTFATRAQPVCAFEINLLFSLAPCLRSCFFFLLASGVLGLADEGLRVWR